MNTPGDKYSPGSAELQLGSGAAAWTAPLRKAPAQNAERELGAPGVPSLNTPKGWYSRSYLPHRDEIGLIQFLTFRLADSLPQKKLQQIEDELRFMPDEIREIERSKRIEHWLDSGLGCCALRHPHMAEMVEQALAHFDGQRYRLMAWCIMPNHVHALIRPNKPLAGIVQSWKSFTGRWALAHNTELALGIPGPAFWMREYWDRYMRDEHHFHRTVEYIHDNPVKAGLCASPQAWPWSSARHLLGTPSSGSAF